MWRIIRLLFLGYWHDKPVHQHKWIKVEEYKKDIRTISGLTNTTMVYVLQCSECGEIKQKEIG